MDPPWALLPPSNPSFKPLLRLRSSPSIEVDAINGERSLRRKEEAASSPLPSPGREGRGKSKTFSPLEIKTFSPLGGRKRGNITRIGRKQKHLPLLGEGVLFRPATRRSLPRCSAPPLPSPLPLPLPLRTGSGGGGCWALFSALLGSAAPPPLSLVRHFHRYPAR